MPCVSMLPSSSKRLWKGKLRVSPGVDLFSYRPPHANVGSSDQSYLVCSVHVPSQACICAVCVPVSGSCFLLTSVI